jgi:N-acetylglucosaminyl-diphospho-decaprenol L-rhamnosyltransferase
LAARTTSVLLLAMRRFSSFSTPTPPSPPGALGRLVAALEAAPRTVMAGPRLVYPDGRFQRSCRRIPNAWRYAWSLSGLSARLPWVRPLDTWYNEAEHRPGLCPGMLSGACFLARRDYLAAIGNFDPRLFLYEEETDLAIPARKRRLRCVYVPEATVLHHGGASTGEHEMSAISEHHLFRSKYLVFHKHYGPAHARLAFWLDSAVLSAAARRQARRGAGTAAQSLARCREAFADYEQLITPLPQSL